MEQQRKTSSFAGFRLSQPGTDKTRQRGFSRTNWTSSLSPWRASSELPDDAKGALGLTTLHEPEASTAPVADIVFIHGLGGGSRKTWSFSPDPSHYWPLAWLPVDRDFADVRIHTFGYKADWGERKQSVLDIHDFGQTLLGALRNHPGIRRTDGGIILVGHGMGGYVAKQAYIIARQDPTAADLADRIHSIFFLGTPHRGSDMASMLKNMLAVAWGKKRVVTDLTRNSSALCAINDAFRHIAPDLRLWSFYETLPVKGAMNRIVVERHSATLGYHNEEIAAMDADHTHVCMFETPSDPNYKMLRNALVTAIDAIREAVTTQQKPPKGATEDMHPASSPSDPVLSPTEITNILRTFLGIQDSTEGDFASLQMLKQPGSCRWFTERPIFTSWKANKSPGILWLMGRPATGKSVLACHVIEQLKPPLVYCSYFICKHSKSGNSTLSDCFRSLAYQMATHDGLVRDAILRLAQDAIAWDKTDEFNIWRRVFVGCIFKLPSIACHFWVMDGVDDCVNFNSLFTQRFLAALPQELRVFATSRPLEQIERGLTTLGPSRATIEHLSETDTLHDMRLFLNVRLTKLGRPENEVDRDSMCERILAKSKGSFLWVRLVLQEFEDAWTEEAMSSILDSVPSDLFDMYSRMAQSIVSDQRKMALAKCVLTWIALSSRPLTVDELRGAIKLDVGQTLQNPAKAIPDVCAQLVYIDQQNKVQMIHETVREFLVTEDSESDLAIKKKDGHTLIASILLKYLCTGVLKSAHAMGQRLGIRSRGFAKTPQAATTPDTSLLNYAFAFFSEHLFRATSADDCLMDSLCDLLKGNTILDWIEHAATTGDLTVIVKTAMNLREYLGLRIKYVPSTDRSVQLVDRWVTDLIRVGAKFRPQLLACPSSIHHLIPPLCPRDSVMSRAFYKDAPSCSAATDITLHGLFNGSWDECLVRLDFKKGQTTAVGHGVRYFAVGLSTGQISIYDPGSVQFLRHVTHPERVKLLEFGFDDTSLASCGSKNLTIWDPKTGVMLQSFPLRSTPLAITHLSADKILCAFQSGILTKWQLETGEEESISWKEIDLDGDQGDISAIIPKQAPNRGTFLATGNDVLLAVAYRSHPVFIWNALDLELLGLCEPEFDNNGVNDMAFNPNSEIPVLVVSYQDGSLCIFDYTTTQLHFRRPQVFAQSIACSPDGRSLVAGTNRGAVEVFAFEQDHYGTTTLALIYRTNHPPDETVRGVAFRTDGLRFVDIRGQQGRVWEPDALVRKNVNELESTIGNSEAETVPLISASVSGIFSGLDEADITSPLVTLPGGKAILAGNSHGAVMLFSATDAAEIGPLYRHARGSSVIALSTNESGTFVVSADDSARVLVFKSEDAVKAASTHASPPHIMLDRRFERGAVVRVLINDTGDKVLVSGRHSDQLWSVKDGSLPDRDGFFVPIILELTANVPYLPPHVVSPDPKLSSHQLGVATLRSSFQYPGNSEWFVIIMGDTARVYSWLDFSEVTGEEGIQLERSNSIEPIPSTASATYYFRPGYVIEVLFLSPFSSPRISVWAASSLNPSSSEATATTQLVREASLEAISPNVLSIIGIIGTSTVVFLDVNFWVCSVELQSVTSVVPARLSALPMRPGLGGSRLDRPQSPVVTNLRRSSARSLTSPLTPMTPDTVQVAQARRHFFSLSEWRTAGGEMRLALASAATGRVAGGSGKYTAVVFGNGSRVVVVRGGLEFSENVTVAVQSGGRVPVAQAGAAGQDVWKVVGGSMHRRGSNW
ncbi:hypothetical protein QBC43DRAFT_303202 [Cladorrhinum sp. PSN259]|nr:hypothetical protein QBC43DRAFT_303202 [Cladorrhinum sp. PSN259]